MVQKNLIKIKRPSDPTQAAGEPTSFGARLKVIRRTCGLTQQQLSQHIGVQVSAVGKYELHENAYPSAETLVRLARYFKVSLDYLLLGKGEPFQLRKEPEPLSLEVQGSYRNLRGVTHASAGAAFVLRGCARVGKPGAYRQAGRKTKTGELSLPG